MAEQPKEAKATDARRGGMSMGMKLVTGLLVVPILAVLMPTFLVLGGAMMPTLVAYIVDRSRAKYLTVTVGLPNICGALPLVVDLWSRGQSYAAAADVLSDVEGVLIAFSAAGLGWLVFFSLTPLVASYYALTSQTRIGNLRAMQETLVESWGEEVASGQDWRDDDPTHTPDPATPVTAREQPR